MSTKKEMTLGVSELKEGEYSQSVELSRTNAGKGNYFTTTSIAKATRTSCRASRAQLPLTLSSPFSHFRSTQAKAFASLIFQKCTYDNIDA